MLLAGQHKLKTRSIVGTILMTEEGNHLPIFLAKTVRPNRTLQMINYGLCNASVNQVFQSFVAVSANGNQLRINLFCEIKDALPFSKIASEIQRVIF